jgi:hypothetical protein
LGSVLAGFGPLSTSLDHKIIWKAGGCRNSFLESRNPSTINKNI